MKIISLYNWKGGTGKSTFSYLLTSYLQTLSNSPKILLIDLDPQCSLSSVLNPESRGNTIFDYFSGKPMKDCIQKQSGFDFIPSDIKLLRVQGGILHNHLSKDISKLDYDYVILDNQPSYNSLVISALYASDSVIIPCLLSQFDLESAIHTIKSCKDIKESLSVSCIVNRISNSTKDLTDFTDIILQEGATVSIFGNYLSIRKLVESGETILKPQYKSIYKSAKELFEGLIV